MSFDVDLLTQAFADIFHRRPLNVKNSQIGAVKVDAGHQTNYSIDGQFLEGDIILRSDSDRLNFVNIQQAGEKELTSINASMEASNGPDLNNIGVYGYTCGQDGNETAKFRIDNAVDISAVDARIYDFSLGAFSWYNPEMTRVVINANDDAGTFFFTCDGQTLRTEKRDFVYTVKNQNIQNVTITAIDNYNNTGNSITKPYNPPRRPSINNVVVQPAYFKYPAGYAAVPFQLNYIGDSTSVASGQRVPHYQVFVGTTRFNTPQPAYIDITFNYHNGDIPYPVNRFEYAAIPSGSWFGQAVRQGGAFNQLVIDIEAVYSPGFFGYFDILARPISSCGTQGKLGGCVLLIYALPYVPMTVNPTYQQNTAISWGPSSEFLGLGLYPDLLQLSGQIIDTNYAANCYPSALTLNY